MILIPVSDMEDLPFKTVLLNTYVLASQPKTNIEHANPLARSKTFQLSRQNKLAIRLMKSTRRTVKRFLKTIAVKTETAVICDSWT